MDQSNSYKEALKRRKMSGASSKSEDDKDRKSDMAPEVRDAAPPDQKVQIDINLRQPAGNGNPLEEGDAVPQSALPDQTGEGHADIKSILGPNSDENDMNRIKQNPRSLFERAAKAKMERK